MTSLIVDASVAVKLVLEEDGWEDARAMVTPAVSIAAPELAPAETWNAVWKRWRRREIGEQQARDATSLIPLLFDTLTPLSVLFPRASELSLSIEHPIYDCFYLALAELENRPLLTADERLASAGRKLIGVQIRRLAEQTSR
jgi:predicted nucleic acid-binding protein